MMAARPAARTKAAAGLTEDDTNADGDHDDLNAAGAHGEAPQFNAATWHERLEPTAPLPEPVFGMHNADQEPTFVSLPASGASHPATRAAGNAASMIPVAHGADADAAAHGFVPEHAVSLGAEPAGAGVPTEIVAAMAAQTRRTKWMLTAAVAALVVTAGVAIAQTLVLASLSANTAAQQQRFDVLMQNQQAALDSVAARLAAPAAVPVAAAVAPATAEATRAAREPTATAPRRHASRATKAPKSREKATSRAAGAKPSKAHSQHAATSRQTAAKS